MVRRPSYLWLAAGSTPGVVARVMNPAAFGCAASDSRLRLIWRDRDRVFVKPKPVGKVERDVERHRLLEHPWMADDMARRFLDGVLLSTLGLKTLTTAARNRKWRRKT